MISGQLICLLLLKIFYPIYRVTSVTYVFINTISKGLLAVIVLHSINPGEILTKNILYFLNRQYKFGMFSSKECDISTLSINIKSNTAFFIQAWNMITAYLRAFSSHNTTSVLSIMKRDKFCITLQITSSLCQYAIWSLKIW